MKNTLSLEEIINIESFQKIQDDIAKATDIAIIMVDYKGKPITSHSNCSKFCSMIRNIEEYSILCEKCDSRGGLESVRIKEAYIYKCHKGLVDFAVPIIVNNQYLGAVMAGQILVEDENNVDLEEIVMAKKNFYNLDENTKKLLESEYNKLPKVSFNKIKSISQMMFHISKYIVEEAVLKMSLNEANYKLTQGNKIDINIEDDQKTTTIVNLKTNDEEFESPIIKAIEYIDDNIQENITLDKISFVCNLSQCYFSKLFKKETGLNFVAYLNEKKVIKAKQLLVNTDKPINNIAIDLGFEDCGYFIRIFKKIEGMTPKKYRDLNKKDSSI
ncbi:PocR ligand-binding domain-containing protein [Romboutsia lituseburensis]|uniref:PocR ligand-binding domain-containing protein n=1 Tax=Romboutsia lituseburensis TaxID=1537 RepID=UPI0022EA936E|nr:PocR ligand-binding domain-containing protein [Romboutsia lituseburensis]